MEEISVPVHSASADEPTLRDRNWMVQQWEVARLKIKDKQKGAVLFLDETQKVTGWAEVVKSLWDEDELQLPNAYA